MLCLVVGCGSIGKRHIRNLQALKLGEIIAHDISPARCEEVESEFQVWTFDNFKKALAQKPDVAFICTPSSLHITQALAAADNGCHLFIEKPLSNNLDGIDELIEMVDKKHLVTLVGCNLRFHPGIAKIKELLTEKSIGQIICARIQAGQYLPDWHPWEDYRHGYSANRNLGGGVILDGVHQIDYSNWFFGDVGQVFCFADKYSSLEIDTEDMAEMLLKFKSGVIVEVHLDYIQRSYSHSCHIIGEEGTILWDINDNQVKLFKASTREWSVFPGEASYNINQMYIEELNHFIQCLKGRAKPMQDVKTGKNVLEIALAAKESAATGKVIKLGGR